MADDRKDHLRAVRVLQLFEPDVGGVPHYVASLTDALRGQGQCAVSAGPTVPAGPSRAMPRHHVAVYGGKGPRWSPLRLCRAFLKVLLLSRKFDIVHAHSSAAGLMAAMVGLLTRRPSVYTPHSWSFDRELPQRVAKFFTVIERVGGYFHRRIITVSDHESVLAVRERIAKSEQVDMVRTGVFSFEIADRNRARHTLGASHDEVVVGWVGRNVRQKQPEELSLVQQRCPSVRIYALGAGLSGSGEGAELEAAGGRVLDDGTAPATLYSAADIFLLTSAWEAFPLSVLEAMSAGLPVVSYDVGDVGAQVVHRRTGFLAPSGDRSTLIEYVVKLSLDVSLRQKMGESAVQVVKERFSRDEMVTSMMRIYRSVLASEGERL